MQGHISSSFILSSAARLQLLRSSFTVQPQFLISLSTCPLQLLCSSSTAPLQPLLQLLCRFSSSLFYTLHTFDIPGAFAVQSMHKPTHGSSTVLLQSLYSSSAVLISSFSCSSFRNSSLSPFDSFSLDIIKIVYMYSTVPLHMDCVFLCTLRIFDVVPLQVLYSSSACLALQFHGSSADSLQVRNSSSTLPLCLT